MTGPRTRRRTAIPTHALRAPVSAALLVLAAALPLRHRQVTRNVIVVTLDTTRADYLPAYGYRDLETPALDRLARDGVVFEEATTSVPLTLPAHCTLFTGLLPPHHHVRDNADGRLDDAQITLAEVFRARGVQTAAFVGSLVVGRDRGLAQGFDTYGDAGLSDARDRNRRRGPAVVDAALAWLQRARRRPFFLWIHLYDAHAPYALPEPYRTMYGDAPYLGALAVLDAQVGRLVDALEKQQSLNSTLVVVAGDHGESFGEHGEASHGILLYQSTLHVPLIMRVPGVGHRRVADVVSLADVMPTILDVAGIPGPAMDGSTLLPLMTGCSRRRDVDAYSESAYPRRFGWSELYALRAGRFKFIDAPRPELYDLDSDPREQHNLWDTQRSVASAMRARLDTWSRVRSAGETASIAVDSERSARLGALGYSSQRAPAVQGHDSEAIDPKDCIGYYNEIVRYRVGAIAQPAGASRGDADRGCGRR
jgi:choline-sulfatase